MPSTTTTTTSSTYFRSVYLVNGDLVAEWEADDLFTVMDDTALGEYGDFADEESATGFFLYEMNGTEARFIPGSL